MSLSPPANLDSDVILVASIVGSDGNSDYVESDEDSPTSPANTPDLAGHISELEEMHEVAEGELCTIAQPTVLFSHTNELEIPELSVTETNLWKTSKTMAPRRRSTSSLPRHT